MNVKDQLLSMLLGAINMVIIGLIGYAYLSDKASAHEKIDTEIEDRKEACSEIKVELSNKVDKDSFKEFKEGQKAIQDYINQSNKEKVIYQDIIKKLSFVDVDTVNVNYEKLVLR